MGLKVSIVPTKSATSTINISESVKTDVENTFAQLKSKPGSEAHLVFDNEADRVDWMRQARSYCSTRKAGALRLRALPSSNLPINEVRVNITDDLEKNGERNGKRKSA